MDAEAGSAGVLLADGCASSAEEADPNRRTTQPSKATTRFRVLTTGPGCCCVSRPTTPGFSASTSRPPGGRCGWRTARTPVQAWVTTLSRTRSPATVRKEHRVLSLILDLAVRDGRLGRNVAEKINLPRPVQSEQRHLTHTQVEALADECGYPSTTASTAPWASGRARPTGSRCSPLAYTGVRFGEMAALRVGRLDLARRREVIAESVTVVAGRGLVWGTPPAPSAPRSFHPAVPGARARGAPSQTRTSGTWPSRWCERAARAAVFRRGHFDAAARAIGLRGLHPHELRHTAASLRSRAPRPNTRPRPQGGCGDSVAPRCPSVRTSTGAGPAGGNAAGKGSDSESTPGRIRTYASASGGRRSIP